MNYVTEGFEPSNVLKIFEDICAIPHGSSNESGVADYIVDFAKKRGLFYSRDSLNNVFVRKNATAGYENTAPIALQGHTDMVCEKNADSDHDFLRDGLKLTVKDGRFLWADGTTLGGDDGIAVAMMLALLDTNAHPTLELLFTVEEETGLGGAIGFDCSCVSAKRMINLDSEEEHQITAGCAGGMRTDVKFEFSPEKLDLDDKIMTVAITGLAGGHSGVDINSGKSNAIVIMARFLSAALSKTPIRLISLSGGGKDNAIARECFAKFAVKNDKTAACAITSEAIEVKKELSGDDGGFLVKVDYDSMQNTDCTSADCAGFEVTEKVISFLTCAKTGVLKMSNNISGLVEYSRNIGVAKTENCVFEFVFSTRSSLEAQIDMAIRELNALTKLSGAKCSHYARYPGWEYQPDSPLRDAYLEAYKKLYGKDLAVGVIHAGLECGILSSKMSGMDIISIGPDIYDIHSPDEHLDLISCARVWNALLEVVRGK